MNPHYPFVSARARHACEYCRAPDFVSGLDEITQTEVRLFNPRLDVWREHFSVVEETGEIEGSTDVGRATALRLRINSQAQVSARKQWLRAGLLKQS